MSDVSKCPNCEAELPLDAPLGLCPQCLLQAGMPEYAETLAPSAGGAEPGQSSALLNWHEAPGTSEIAPFFPHLEVLELVGQGGMGAVYKARQPKLDRDVALKILPPKFGNDENFSQRFMREAQALAKLSHPNIVTVHDFGMSNGLYYLVMEFVDGVNLRDSLVDGRLTPEEALAIVPQLCDALQFAHEEGVVHRDIKPENVLVDRRGRVKIADFGLAKLLDNSQEKRQLTVTNQVMGTLNYMAPEQVETPLDVDHRADIYSLGVVFYELLTGELPIGRFAPPSEKATVSRELDDVVMRTLEKEPDRRYQQASDVKTAVQHAASAAETPAMRHDAVARPLPAVPEAEKLKPNLGAIVLGSVMLLLALILLAFAVQPGGSVFAWISLGIALGGAGVLGSAWNKEKLQRRRELEHNALVLGIAMCVIGLGMLGYACYHIHPGNVFIWIGLGITLGGGGCLGGAWGTEETASAKAAARKPLSLPEAQARLQGPAIGLMVTGALGLVGALALAAVASWQFSTGSSATFALLFGAGAPLLVSIPMMSLLLIAGWKMTQVQFYGLAISASIIALIPFHLGFVIGLPLGIWSLVVLADPQVKEAFRMQR